MNATQDCPLTQQAVGWALHSLEPDEEMAVLLHLPQCAACRAAAHDAEQVLAALGGSVPLVEPPTGLRDRLMAEVADTPQRPPVLRPRHAEPDDAAPQPGRLHRLDAEASRPARTSWLARGSRGRRVLAASLAAAAVLSFGGLAVRATQLEQERNAETAQAQSLTELLDGLGQPGSEYALLTDPAGVTVAAVLVRDGERQVYPVELPANAGDQIYVAWGLPAEGAPVPLAAFDVTGAEQGPLPVGSVSEAQDFEQYAVSIEPGRVAPSSPSTVVASGQVTI